MEQLINYYTNLLIKQYWNKPKARATIELFINNRILLYNNILKNFIDSFNVKTAMGKQLDMIGAITGVSRVYEGIEFTDTPAPNQLDDETYRLLILMKIINNYSMNSIKSIADGVYNFLNDKLVFVNNTDMTISYIIFGENQSDNIIKIIVKNRNILPAPAGVWVNYIVRITDNKIFGFSKNNGIEQEFISGFSTNNNLVEGTFLNNNNII